RPAAARDDDREPVVRGERPLERRLVLVENDAARHGHARLHERGRDGGALRVGERRAGDPADRHDAGDGGHGQWIIVRTSQRTSAVRALPTVPGATGTHPAPPAVAMISATRSAAATRLGALADQLVSLDLGDGHAREPAGLEAAAEVDDAVDLGRLAGGA